MSTTNFGRGHATQAQEAPVRGSGDGYSLRSRSVDASATVGNRRPTHVRYPKGPESTLDTEIELKNAIEQQNLTPVTHVDTENLTLDRTENLTVAPVRTIRSRSSVNADNQASTGLLLLSLTLTSIRYHNPIKLFRKLHNPNVAFSSIR